MRRAALWVTGGTVGSIHSRKEWIFTVRPLIDLANTFRAQAKRLIRLMAGRAGAAIRPQALKEGALFVDVAGAVECRDCASLVLKMLEIRDDENQGSRSAQRNGGQGKTGGSANPGIFHVTLPDSRKNWGGSTTLKDFGAAPRSNNARNSLSDGCRQKN
jgi:hypothetical protein